MSSPRQLRLFCLVLPLLLFSVQVSARQSKSKQETSILPYMLKPFTARSIGPAVMGGRVSDISLDPKDQFTFYVGLGTGGVMKTSNDGASFDAVFAKEAVAAVGAVAVSPSNSNYVWVGTGEANDRNSSSWGNGVYLSTDGGGSWTNVGLKESKTIARIIAHPTDSLTAYVAAMGDLWSPSRERGLYKTTDGGKNWRPVLTASTFADRIGCGDVVMDPATPTTLYATLYGRMRTPWSFSYGADATGGKDLGGIFKSTDGGGSWKKLSNGLPGKTGRIGLAIYARDPRIVYAIVQSDEGGTSSIDEVKSKHGGVFRSEDGGESWTRMNALNPRPFYFSQIRVDPSNDKRVYLLGYMMHVSDDGGTTFREDHFEKVHPDCHALAIDPRNPKRLILGTDGGVYLSFASGKGWIHLNNFAAGEFYRIAVDMRTPYRIAGGLQDNLNWVGPSATRTKDGIVNSDWVNIGGGDGFYCVFDPHDSNVVYAESQQGYVHKLNLSNGEFKNLRPEPAEGQQAFRFHWNSPLLPAIHEKGAMFLAGNRVFKLKDRGEKFQIISPDLSRQDPEKIMTVGSGAENFGVVYTLAESPVKQGTLWAGTDDGKLWLTVDEGGRWQDLTRNLPPQVKNLWISRIEASPHDANTAFVAIDGHRSGDYAPHLLKTSDGGKSWKSVAGNLPTDGPVKVVRQGRKNPHLLFAGTEFNLFISLNDGVEWSKFGDLPTVAVDDIVIHPRDLDLVIATHGRSLFIVDDISPLENFADSIRQKDAHMFATRPATGFYPLPGFSDWNGTATFRGANPPEGAVINYWVKEYTGEPVKIAITNAAGQPVANLTGPGTPGFNRIVWDLRLSKEFLTDYGGEGQKFVKGGEYTFTMNYGKSKQTQKPMIAIAPGIETR